MEVTHIKESPKEIVKNLIDLISEKYSSNALLRVAISFLPYGSLLDIVVSNHASQIQLQRLNELLSFIIESGRFNTNSGSKTDDNELFDITAKALKVGLFHRHSVKRNLLAEILLGATNDTPELTIDWAEDLIQVTDSINILEMKIFSTLTRIMAPFHTYPNSYVIQGRPQHNYSQIGKGNRVLSDTEILKDFWLVGYDDGVIENSLHHLRVSNLIKEISGGYVDYSGGCHNITSKGDRFIKFLSTTGEEL